MRKRRSMLVAYLLWAFFGVFGIHRIYLGRWISGGLWFFTGGLLGIGWLVDAVLTYYMVKEENSIPLKEIENYVEARVGP